MKKLLDDPEYALQLGLAGRKRVIENYEQKQLWRNIVSHRYTLLEKAGKYKVVNGNIKRL